MTEFAPIWSRAKRDLLIAIAPERYDPVIWERAERVAEMTLIVATFPELAGQRLDRQAMLAAALYHDAGWLVQLNHRKISRHEIFTRPITDAQRDLAAAMLEKSLHDLMPDASRETAVLALRECNRKATDLLEAHVLCEAINLDDMGPHALCVSVRRHIAEGKGVESVLDIWHRQQEYHYWEARLKECLRFETSRRVAEQRLAAMGRVMDELRRYHRLEDLRDFVAGRRGMEPGDQVRAESPGDAR
jgi:hypothetical protein